jgi:short-subunit dehydrogenase
MKKENVLITGASSGVGLSAAKFLSDRFHVIAVARRIDKLDQELGGMGSISCYPMDLCDFEAVTVMIEQIVKEKGNIYRLVNNAGILTQGEVCSLSSVDMSYALKVNGLAPIFILQQLLPKMKHANFGRVVNITSGAPLNCMPRFGAYSASKAYLNSMTVTQAKELLSFNIKVNLMSPGPVKSEMSPKAKLDPSICHSTMEYLLNLSMNGPSGKFFWLGYEVPLFPDLEGVDWLSGIGNEKLNRVMEIEPD